MNYQDFLKQKNEYKNKSTMTTAETPNIKYSDFLNSKQIEYKQQGIEVAANELNPNLFDFQKDITSWALHKGRCAIFADCGMGKTAIQCEWANNIIKKTGGSVLILAPLGVTKQTPDEAYNILGVDVSICRSQDDVKPGINITNYDMLSHFDASFFDGVALDESSILKNFTGKTRMQLTEAFKDTPYKLSCTATPAPNDYMELLNQADWLGVMDTAKALSMWFINDMKTGKWRLKGHAVQAFWEWVSSWAVYIEKPSDIGYCDDGYILPKLNEQLEIIDIDLIDHDYTDGFIRHIDTSATGFHKEKRNTADARAKRTADIVQSTNEQYIVWCDTNYESELLKKYIPEAVEVKGSDKTSYKENMAYAFKNGEIRVLISKPSIFGYGMNFQNCHNAVFCGMTYSYEDYYQALKRLYRFGQKHQVNNYIVLGSTEKHILDVVRDKASKQAEMEKNMINCIRDIQITNFNRNDKKIRSFSSNVIELPEWLGGNTNAVQFKELRIV